MLHKRLSGRDLHEPTNCIVENHTGSTIPALKVVRLNGKGTSFPKIELAQPNVYVNFGVVYDPIPNGKHGQVCAFGFMIDVDTSPWAAGTILYSDNSGNLTTSVNGGVVAQVVYQHADYGILYVVTEPNPTILSNAWYLTGNNGTDPNNHFLGTTDAKDLVFRTNNTEKLRITESGRLGLGINNPSSHFHQKSHTGYPGTGLRQETFVLSTNSTNYEQIFSVPLPDPCVARIEIVVLGRTADGVDRCMFKRTGLFYRENSNVQAQNHWLSDQTIKSNNNLNIRYVLGISDLELQVRSSTSGLTYWTGHIKIEILSTS